MRGVDLPHFGGHQVKPLGTHQRSSFATALDSHGNGDGRPARFGDRPPRTNRTRHLLGHLKTGPGRRFERGGDLEIRVDVPLGAETADGYDDLVRVVRSQIGRSIDVVKIYADYRWGPDRTAAPTFTQEELETIVEITRSSGRPVAAHASTPEAIRRAVLAGVETIEHGDGATRD